MAAPADQDITGLLRRLADGDASASEELFQHLHAELKRLARNAMGDERTGHTLQATALVNEAYVKLLHKDNPSFENRNHFLGVAAQAMRFVLVDHARARRTGKRGGDRERVALDMAVEQFEEASLDLLALDEALTALAELDPHLSRMVELRFFAGLEIDDVASILGISTRTVNRGWVTAKAFLRTRLQLPDDS